MKQRNKQVVKGKTNKQTSMQTKKKSSKTILETVGRWDTKDVTVTQVRPTDSAINYREKKSKSEPRKLTSCSSHPGAAHVELNTTY